MNDLSDDAKALFDAARSRHEPTQEDREQVRNALLVRIGGAAATLGVAQTGAAASLAPGAALASGGKVLLAFKLVVGLTVAGGAGTVAYRGLATDTTGTVAASTARARSPIDAPSDRARALPPPIVQQGIQGAKQALSEADSAVSPPAKPPPSEVKPTHQRAPAGLELARPRSTAFPEPERRSPPAGATAEAGTLPDEPARSSMLSLEARALSNVQRAVREGRSGEALALLDQQDRDFPRGELRQERVAARVVALCAAGRASEARALAVSFLARAPRSPLAARMRTTCAGQ